MMPQNFHHHPVKPCSPISLAFQNDYYQHDQNESLDAMTTPATTSEPLSVKSSPSTSSCSTLSATAMYSSLSPVSRWVAKNSPSHRVVSDEGSRIPRRVKFSAASGNNAACDSHSSPCLAGGTRPQTVKQRSSFTSSGQSMASSVVSSCLLANSCLGGGDGVSSDSDLNIWLDMIPLSRKPFKNFYRDFADGVLMAEIMANFFPKKVDLHNYVPASASSGKKANYDTLNQKVFSKIGVKLADNLIDGIIQAKPGYIEKALQQVHRVIDNVDRLHVETRAKELCCLAGSFNGSSSPSLEPPFVEEFCLVRSIPGEIPDCVIYQNIKYYPSTTLEENAKTEEQLREKNNELCNKVSRLETLLNLKESHLQDLTSKIHEMRPKHEPSQQGVPDY